MKKATSNTTSEVMNAKEFKQKSYDAYLAYVDFIEGKKSISETVDALSPLMAAYGLILTLENLANLLTVKMTAYGKDKGEQAKKVKSISTFRAFVKAVGRMSKPLPCTPTLAKTLPMSRPPRRPKSPRRPIWKPKSPSWKPCSPRRSPKNRKPLDALFSLLRRLHPCGGARLSLSLAA